MADLAILDHNASEKDAGEGRALVGHGRGGALHNLVHDLVVQMRSDDRRGRVGAHATRVGACVPLANRLVILHAKRQPRACESRAAASESVCGSSCSPWKCQLVRQVLHAIQQTSLTKLRIHGHACFTLSQSICAQPEHESAHMQVQHCT